MKIEVHPSESRGESNLDWLSSRFSFSFAEYRNPNRMGFGALRVINDDIIRAAKGFGTHPHANMEIVTVPLSGSLEHKDSTGSVGVIRHGEVQLMSAGSGIAHSEYNPSPNEDTTLLQIWVRPSVKDTPPSYQQKRYPEEGRQNHWQLLVSPTGEDRSLKIKQNAYFSLNEMSQPSTYSLHGADQGVFLFLIEGEIEVSGNKLKARDAIAVSDTLEVPIECKSKSLLLAIEVPLNF